MNIFKRLFGKKQKAEEKKQECWYNNAHEIAESNLGAPLENANMSNNVLEYTTAKNAAQK